MPPSDTPPHDDDLLSEGIQEGIDDMEIIDELELIGSYIDEDDTRDDSVITFCKHSEPVFCCGLDKDFRYAVTGGQDDKAYMWNPSTGEVIFESTGHIDSVLFATFSHDSKYVATADMSGKIQVWNTRENNSLTWTYDVSIDLNFLEWHHGCNALFGGFDDGSCWVWRVPGDDVKTIQTSGSATSSGHIMPDGVRGVVGYLDGSVRILDLKSAVALFSITGNSAHASVVSCLACHADNNLVITGSVDGTGKLIKSNDGRVVCTLPCEPEETEMKSVEAVSFFTGHSLIATGTLSGKLAVWDIPTQVRRLQWEQESGISKLICDPVAPMVYTSGVDGVVRLIDGRTGQLERAWHGHEAAVLDMVLSTDRNVILSCSEDCSAKIFDIRR